MFTVLVHKNKECDMASSIWVNIKSFLINQMNIFEQRLQILTKSNVTRYTSISDMFYICIRIIKEDYTAREKIGNMLYYIIAFSIQKMLHLCHVKKCAEQTNFGHDMHGTLSDVSMDNLERFLKGLQKASPFAESFGIDFYSDAQETDQKNQFGERPQNLEEKIFETDIEIGQTIVKRKKFDGRKQQIKIFKEEKPSSVNTGYIVITYSDIFDTVDILYRFVSRNEGENDKGIYKIFKSDLQFFNGCHERN